MDAKKRNQNEIVVRDPDTGDLQIIDCITGELISSSSKPQELETYVFRTLTSIGKDPKFPPLHVIQHWQRTQEMFKQELMLARKSRAEYYHDKVAEITENAANLKYGSKEEIAQAKLAADQSKWLAEKGNGERYGSKVVHEGSTEKPIVMRVINTGISRRPDIVIEPTKEVTNEEKEPRQLKGKRDPDE
jgi:hypothetical protein